MISWQTLLAVALIAFAAWLNWKVLWEPELFRRLAWGRHCFRCDKEREEVWCDVCFMETIRDTRKSGEKDGRFRTLLDSCDWLRKNGYQPAATALLKHTIFPNEPAAPAPAPPMTDQARG